MRPICEGCGEEIDPEVCGCGVEANRHSAWNEGHVFVPMGCECSRDRAPAEGSEPKPDPPA